MICFLGNRKYSDGYYSTRIRATAMPHGLLFRSDHAHQGRHTLALKILRDPLLPENQDVSTTRNRVAKDLLRNVGWCVSKSTTTERMRGYKATCNKPFGRYGLLSDVSFPEEPSCHLFDQVASCFKFVFFHKYLVRQINPRQGKRGRGRNIFSWLAGASFYFPPSCAV